MSVRCPFCDSDRVRLVALFGSQLLLSQFQCEGCRTYFEGLRPDRDSELPDETKQAQEPEKEKQASGH